MGARNLVLVRLGILNKLDWPLQPAKRLQRGLLQILTHLLDMILVVLAEKSVLNQVHLHAFGMGEPPQRAAEEDPVKTRQSTLNLGAKLGDKLFHGVSSRCTVVWISLNVPLRKRHFPVCGLPQCGADNPGCSRLSGGFSVHARHPVMRNPIRRSVFLPTTTAR